MPAPVGCNVPQISYLGDDFCDGYPYNTPECDYDGGDCITFNEMYPLCNVSKPWTVGNGHCSIDGEYNVTECDYDGGDCLGNNITCNVPEPKYVGDYDCDGYPYNTPECLYDGGDCATFNLLYPKCTVPEPSRVGDGECDNNLAAYNVSECGYDGGDCLL